MQGNEVGELTGLLIQVVAEGPETEDDLRANVESLLLQSGVECTCPPLVQLGDTEGLVRVHLRQDEGVAEIEIPFTVTRYSN